MVINIITCVVCLVLLIVFRKLDRTNIKMAKLRRYSSRLFDDYKKMAETENRRFNDATIEMDILIKKSNALAKNVSSSILEIESKLQGLDIEKTNLKKVEEDIKVISQSARDVNIQIEFIANAKNNFNEMARSMSGMKETIKILKSESGGILQNFNERIKEKSKELTSEFAQSINKLREAHENKEELMLNAGRQRVMELAEQFDQSTAEMERRMTDTGEILLQNFKMKIEGVARSVEGAANLHNQIEILKNTYAELENKIFSEIKERSEAVETDIQASLNDLNDRIKEYESGAEESKSGILERFSNDVDKLYAKLATVETNVNESKSKLIKTFETEVEKVRSEIDNLSIHAISKRDEIVNATRREAEELRKEIAEFDEKFLTFENRLVDTAAAKGEELRKSTDELDKKLSEFESTMEVITVEKTERLSSAFQSYETRMNNLMDKLNTNESQLGNYLTSQMQKIKDDFSIMEQNLSDMKTDILNYEEQSKLFSRTDSLVNEVNGSIERLNRMLQDSQKETQHMEKFFADIDHIKELSKELDREIRSYQTKKEKIGDIETEIRTLQEMSDHALEKSNGFQDQFARIDAVSSRIDAMTESYTNLESRIRELNEYEDVIMRNLDSVNKADIMIQSVEAKINSFQKVVDRSDKRVEKINLHLRAIEENTMILKSRENEIKDVKDKFGELEGLSEHMETRIKQIYAMFQKIETLREEINSTDNRLQELFSETDRKMRQFADFIQAVDNNNPILKQVKGNAVAPKNLNENVIRTVRELSDKGWSSGEISKKLMMDENAVRLIINTSSL